MRQQNKFILSSEKKFVLAKEKKVAKNFKCKLAVFNDVLMIGAIILSKLLEISSVRQLKAETMG